jgi:hypothetical protein
LNNFNGVIPIALIKGMKPRGISVWDVRGGEGRKRVKKRRIFEK